MKAKLSYRLKAEKLDSFAYLIRIQNCLNPNQFNVKLQLNPFILNKTNN
jgi:hypothetical protein